MTLHSKKAIWVCTIVSVATLVLTGCVTTQPSPAEPETATYSHTQRPIQEETLPETSSVTTSEENRPYVHTVKWPGETLSYISKWYTGKYANWRLLAKANPGINPNIIKKGNKIVIPEKLLKKRAALPKNFVAKLTPKNRSEETKKQVPQKNETKLPLFGPKQ